ncbi:unnamed protein product [Rodentolepis nana]|uniref:Uncharacterized protein n=1 Tax=Rodentolepis nana TaxID=102285 RepID=A0A3P7RX15_RODNA|nr:unnamed protein product [Rodentolepis nana]
MVQSFCVANAGVSECLTVEQTRVVLIALSAQVDQIFDIAAEVLSLPALLEFIYYILQASGAELAARARPRTPSSPKSKQPGNLKQAVTNVKDEIFKVARRQFSTFSGVKKFSDEKRKATESQGDSMFLDRLSHLLLRVIRSPKRPLLHLLRAWTLVSQHLVDACCFSFMCKPPTFIEADVEKLLISQRALSCLHECTVNTITTRLELPYFCANEMFCKPFEILLRLELSEMAKVARQAVKCKYNWRINSDLIMCYQVVCNNLISLIQAIDVRCFASSIGLSDLKGNEEELRKSLPHVDLETGLKNRGFNKTLLTWDADTAVPLAKSSKNSTKSVESILSRNPIALTGNLGNEVDALRCTSRPRKQTSRGPKRDPIAGRGDFGEREWDPIWKYNGRIARARSSTGIRCNPLTGENAKSFDISTEEKRRCSLTPKTPRASRNVITGENCADFDISQEMKPVGPRRRMETGKNTVTGENCETYDVNVETKPGRSRVRARSEGLKGNPLTGENVATFTISKEEKKRNMKSYVYTNTVTGENCLSYKITPIERNVTSRPNTAPSNPLLGENTQNYIYRVGEKEKAIKVRDLDSPLTGEGSRGSTYSISVEERRRKPADYSKTRNVLTGDNCNTYQICQEMRSERKSSAPPTSRGQNSIKLKS